jgi:hypothetical protein
MLEKQISRLDDVVAALRALYLRQQQPGNREATSSEKAVLLQFLSNLAEDLSGPVDELPCGAPRSAILAQLQPARSAPVASGEFAGQERVRELASRVEGDKLDLQDFSELHRLALIIGQELAAEFDEREPATDLGSDRLADSNRPAPKLGPPL